MPTQILLTILPEPEETVQGEYFSTKAVPERRNNGWRVDRRLPEADDGYSITANVGARSWLPFSIWEVNGKAKVAGDGYGIAGMSQPPRSWLMCMVYPTSRFGSLQKSAIVCNTFWLCKSADLQR